MANLRQSWSAAGRLLGIKRCDRRGGDRRAARGARAFIGCLDGFKWLMEGEHHATSASCRSKTSPAVHLQGGSILHTSRANPTKKAETLEAVVKSLAALGIDHLITIGGDDTAFSGASRRRAGTGPHQGRARARRSTTTCRCRPASPTFGYETARKLATTLVENLIEDCRTTNRWFYVVVMGRKSVRFALGAGKSAGAPITLIPEEFPPARSSSTTWFVFSKARS